MRDDHPIPCRRQQRGNIDEAMDVIGPAVQKNDRCAISRAGFSITCFNEANDVLVPGLIGG
jgi:hypothetical protein